MGLKKGQKVTYKAGRGESTGKFLGFVEGMDDKVMIETPTGRVLNRYLHSLVGYEPEQEPEPEVKTPKARRKKKEESEE